MASSPSLVFALMLTAWMAKAASVTVLGSTEMVESPVCPAPMTVGTLLVTVLKRHPAVQGVLFERPQVAAGAGRVLDATGVRDRVAVQSRIPPFPL